MSSDIRQLHAEIAQIKNDVTRLASEDSIRDLSDRWSLIEREMQTLPESLGSRKDLMNVASRVDDLYEMLSELPRSLPVTAMEAQIRALATAVEQMAMQNNSVSGSQLDTIDARLDEVSRAISTLSSSVSNSQFDAAPLDRIEARIATLTRQLEEQANIGVADTAEFDRRFAEIGQRLDALHATAERAFSDDRINSLNKRFDDVAAALSDLTQLAHSEDSSSQDLAALDAMAAQLSDVLEGLDAQKAHTTRTVESMTRSFDEGMETLAQRISEQEIGGSAIPGIQNLERRMEEIASLMNTSHALAAPEGAAGPDLTHLENQISELSRHLSENAAPAPASNDILGERLAAIEDRLVHSDDDIMAIAMQAAEQAVTRATMNGSPQEAEFVSQLADRLNELDDLARSSNKRNDQTFEAIHDTLLKVVDHLSNLEGGLGSAGAAPISNDWHEPAEPSSKLSLKDSPSLDYADDFDDGADNVSEAGFAPEYDDALAYAEPEAMPAEPSRQIGQRAQGLSPSQAAAAAALAALSNDRGSDADADVPSVDAPRADVALRGGEPRFDDDLEQMEDELLEPGTGGPDLASIIQRVRDERLEGEAGGRPAISADAGKNDFIAAARRRAQAAAADTEMIIKPENDKGKKRRLGEGGKFAGLTQTLSSKRKPILMGAGAILLALLAVPVVSGYLSGGDGEKIADAGETSIVEPVNSTVAGGGDSDDGSMIMDDGNDVDLAMADDANDDGVRQIEQPDEAGMPEMASGTDDETIPAVEDGSVQQVAADLNMPESVGSVALREAAASGDPKALYVVGEAIIAENGDNDDAMVSSADWYKRAADLGYAPAQYRIGLLKEKGTGIDQDIQGAMTYYQLAAQQGNVSAMHNLAVLLASGATGTPDIDSAVQWFQKAAERGVLNSQYNLGVLYGQGKGVPKDLKESYKWFSLVANAGDASAAGPRDEVAAIMAPEDLEIARGIVDLWKPKAVDSAANSVSVPQEWQSGQERTASVEPKQDPADMKKAVQNIQAILNNAGYDAGPVDGMMGGKTRKAILQFQKDNGLVQTGEVDRALVEKLLEVNKSAG